MNLHLDIFYRDPKNLPINQSSCLFTSMLRNKAHKPQHTLDLITPRNKKKQKKEQTNKLRHFSIYFSFLFLQV